MARVKLTAGAEIDVVTPDELRMILGEFTRAPSGPQDERPMEGVALDGSGNGSVTLFEVPRGMRFALHRLLLIDDTHTPAVPFTNANGYAYVARGERAVSFLGPFTAANGGIPYERTWNESAAPRWSNLEAVTLQIVGGPVSASLLAIAQGTLSPATIS